MKVQHAVVKSFNNSFHISIGITHSDVNKSNESKVASRLYGDILSVDNLIIFNFNIVDYVRIPIEKNYLIKDMHKNGLVTSEENIK